MGNIGSTELIIIGIIFILIFGVGRIGKIGQELGEGIKGLREGLTYGEDEED